MSQNIAAQQAVSTAVAEPGTRNVLASLGLKDAPGWLVSLGMHLVAFALLMAMKIHTDSVQDSSVLTAMEDVEQQQMAFDHSMQDQVGSGAEVTTLSAPGQAAAAAGSQSNNAQQDAQQRVDEDFKDPDAPATDDRMALPGGSDLTASVGGVLDGGGGTENVAGSGGGGVEGAIDRLSFEIVQSLHQKKTTVIWLFDQSLSLKERRDAIADRFENVYRQIESLDEGGKGALTTVAATYGEKFTLLTDKPVDDVKSIIPKVRAIPNDPSGKENVFSAVNMLVNKFKGERGKGRNVMIFVITDEKGDDADKFLEDTIVACRRAGIKVYTVGNAALFGREKGFVAWKYPDNTTEDIEVDAGPETVEPEAIVLGFWGNRAQDLNRMSSGYGPYAMTRLCKETGGLYFIAQEDEKGPRFSPAIMRNYQPDYRPIRDYQKSLEKNKAKLALVSAAKATKIENVPLPNLQFTAYNDNILREGITEAQKPAAELIYKIDRLVEMLSQGEKDREKISEPRWRAAYDLAIGRALAMKVRSFGYNQMLAEMKGTPKTFAKKDSNEWNIVPSKTINAGAAVKKIERQAATYLKRVMDEHPDTPWAMLAERELSTPMGWDWQEKNNPQVLAAGTSPDEAKKQIRLAEEKRKEAAKKMPPPPPQKDKPKL